MNHDICHCSDADCKFNKTCVRYKAHLEVIERQLDYITYYAETPRNKETDTCDRYWEDQIGHI